MSDYVSGFLRTDENGAENLHNGRLDLFRNHDEHGNAYPRPRIFLIDRKELDSDEALDPAFR